MGKTFFVGQICDNIEDNPHSADWWYEALVSSPLLRQHRDKQKYAFYEAVGMFEAKHPMSEVVRSGELDREKQQALYVELANDHVLTPTRIGEAKAFRFLKHVVEVFDAALEIAGCSSASMTRATQGPNG